MKRRILFVEGSRDGTVGGSHVCLLRMLANLDRGRFEPTALFHADHHIAGELRAMGVAVLVLPAEAPLRLASFLEGRVPAGRFLSSVLLPAQKLANFTWHFLRPAIAHARFLNAYGFDVVHLNNSVNTNHDWMLAARLAGARLISHERGISERMSRTSRFLARWIDRHICMSKQIRDALIGNGVRPERATVVYDGIDPRQTRPERGAVEVRAALGVPGGAPVIGVVGNVKRWKGQETVVRATGVLVATWPDLRCLLVGGAVPGDSYPQELKRLARDLGIERNVVFTGFQERPADLMNAMDVVVHSSITPEPFGMVNIEAMALRKPVVATRMGGPTEIFDDGRNGYLVEPADPNRLAEVLSLLLADPELRTRVGALAYDDVTERFTIASTLRGIERVYDEVCG
jgi:glycosyltransferase involved in cell wall biosynthesis